MGGRFGGADIYVANAGINLIQATPDVTPGDYDAQLLTNARGTFFGVQRILPVMRDGGAIILTSSIAARKVLDGQAVYAGSKAAIEAFARNWALELKDRRIRVNVLSPGPTAASSPASTSRSTAASAWCEKGRATHGFP